MIPAFFAIVTISLPTLVAFDKFSVLICRVENYASTERITFLRISINSISLAYFILAYRHLHKTILEFAKVQKLRNLTRQIKKKSERQRLGKFSTIVIGFHRTTPIGNILICKCKCYCATGVFVCFVTRPQWS